MSLEYLLSASSGTLVNNVIVGIFSWYIISSIGVAFYNLYFHPLAKFPGPASRAAFYFPNAFSISKGIAYKDISFLHGKYGSVVRIQPNTLSFNNAQAWKDIYALKPDRTELAKEKVFYGKSEDTHIVSANQTDHARMRKLLAHAFSDTALLEQEPLLTLYFDLLISELKKKIDGPARGRVDMMAYYNFSTFDIIGDLVLGEPFGALKSGEYHSWIRNIFGAIKASAVIRFVKTYPALGLLLKVLQPVLPSFTAKRVAHMEFTKTKIDQRLDRKTDRKDIISYVLRYNDERGMTRTEILTNARTLLTAGSETSASILSGATYFLLQNPAMLHRAQTEVREAFKSADDITLRSVSTPGLLPYLESVLQESFRCYPSIPTLLPRITGPGGAVIDGNFVPANTSVGVHQWSAYHSAANFASPYTFAPERWLSDPPAEYRNDDKAALQPFSLGPRGCIGKSLAYFEIRSILCRVLWHFDMQIEEESQGWTKQKEYTVWDKPSLWVRLEHRAILG